MATTNPTIAALGDVQTTLLALHALASKYESGEIIPDDNFAHIVAELISISGQRLDACIAEMGGTRFGWDK